MLWLVDAALLVVAGALADPIEAGRTTVGRGVTVLVWLGRADATGLGTGNGTGDGTGAGVGLGAGVARTTG